ncbi:MAG: ABC transporter permease subunit [Streptosporangiaceae bacterium]
MPEVQAAGVIHDLGYRGYDGPRLGRAQIVKALTWHSFRSAFGIGRGPKAKVVPLIAFVAMCLPAVVNAVAVAKGGAPVVGYGTYEFALRVVVMTIFVAVQAPELVSRDLRSRVMPLYFSRPMRRGDYPLAKYAAFTAACLAMIEIPLLLLFLGNIVSSAGGSQIWTQARELGGGLAVGLLWAVLLAAIGLAIASLSGRRAYATGAVAIFFFLTWTLAMIISQITGRTAGAFIPGQAVPVSERLAGLVSPFSVVDGIRQWLGGHAPAPGPIPSPGSYGIAYGVVFLVLLAASFAILAARYRRTDLV